MISFKDIELQDKELITSYTQNSPRRNCDLSFSNLCSWRFLYNTKFAIMDGFLLLKFWANDELVYMMPIGNGDLTKVLDALVEDGHREGEPFCLLGICSGMCSELEAFMPVCRAEYTTVDAVCAARNFRCHACRIIEKGWFGIFERESVNAGREYGFSPIPQLENGETAAVTGCSLIHRKDLPVSAYTDAELITYMDTAGLGTAATRTGILQTLIDRKYVR